MIAQSEVAPTMERAAEHGAAMEARAALSPERARPSALRAGASWASLGGDDARALRLAREALAARPGDVVSLDVVRAAGRRLGRWAEVAEACEALGAAARDPARAAAFWEEAGAVAADALGDDDRAERALRASLSREPGRPVAYRKLRAILEARGDTQSLEALVSGRLGAVDDEAERAGLYWEQARLRRALGLREGALESATRVVELDPSHVAALAMVAEVHAASGRLDETAAALAALAACAAAPEAQRRAARLGAMELYQHRLHRPDEALAQAEAMVDAGWADDALLDRALTLATESARWPAALRFARRAAEVAPPGAPRAEALLRVAGLLRDQLRDVPAARDQALRAHDAAPASLAVLRALLPLCAPDERARHARRAVEALREQMRVDAPTVERARDLAEVCRHGTQTRQRSPSSASRRCRRMASPGARLRWGACRGGPHLRDAPLVLRATQPGGRRAVVPISRGGDARASSSRGCRPRPRRWAA
ncbi:MAG: hypothetical protein R3A52_18475 [Polyangiales bacterium]